MNIISLKKYLKKIKNKQTTKNEMEPNQNKAKQRRIDDSLADIKY